MSCIVDIATIVGAFGTVCFGILTFVLTLRANRMQDIVAATSGFPVMAFSGCQLFPTVLTGVMDYSQQAVDKYLSGYIDMREAAWKNADYIILLYSQDEWPLNIKISHIYSLSISIDGKKTTFLPKDNFTVRNTNEGQYLFIALKRTSEKDSLDILNRFLLYPTHDIQQFRNAELQMRFKFENLFLSHRAKSRLQLKLLLQCESDLRQDINLGIPEITVLERSMTRI